ncbi:Uncharacterised protein [Klebsiella oxytoca]|nr:Uncharacterised protein [Klebsiella oxytoca]
MLRFPRPGADERRKAAYGVIVAENTQRGKTPVIFGGTADDFPALKQIPGKIGQRPWRTGFLHLNDAGVERLLAREGKHSAEMADGIIAKRFSVVQYRAMPDLWSTPFGEFSDFQRIVIERVGGQHFAQCCHHFRLVIASRDLFHQRQMAGTDKKAQRHPRISLLFTRFAQRRG